MVFISVVIIAYDRKTYLMKALKSVLDQDFDDQDYEIIIIKNFEDPEIDSAIYNKLNQRKFKSIRSEDTTLSGKIHESIKECSGEIIAFLEDDDMFCKNKLETIANAFNEGEAVYFHNQFIAVNENDDIIPFNFETPEFNVSCISVRKREIDWSKLVGLNDNLILDSFLFYSSIQSGKPIIISKEKLNYYRVHKSISNTSTFKPFKEFCTERVSGAKQVYCALEKYQNIFSSPQVKSFIKNRMVFQKMKQRIMGKDSIITLGEYLTWFFTRPYPKSNLKTDYTYQLKIAILSIFPNLVRKNVALKLYYTERKKIGGSSPRIEKQEVS